MRLALRIVSISRDLEKRAAVLFDSFGMTPAQFNVMNLLADQPEGMRASDLAQALIVHPSNVTGLLKRMERDGLIVALENSGDRRQHRVGLTPEGRAAWQQAHPAYEAELDSLEAGLDQMDRLAAEEVLGRLADRLSSSAASQNR